MKPCLIGSLAACIVFTGCAPAAVGEPPTDARPLARDLGDMASDGMLAVDMPSDDSPGDAMAVDAMPRDAMPQDAMPQDVMPQDASRPDQGPPDQGPPVQGPPDQGPPDQGPPDQGPPDQGPSVGLHVVGSDPPRIGWIRGGQAELAPFDPFTGPGAPVAMGPPEVDEARFVAIGDAIHLVWSDAAGVWLGAEAARRVGDGALRGVAVYGDGIIALTTDVDPGRGRLVRVHPAAEGDAIDVFEVEPDARELLGVAVAGDQIGVLTGDARSDGLYLYHFAVAPDGALMPGGRVQVCPFGCDRPKARIAGGPALAVLYQSTGELHRFVGDARVVLGGVWRGGALDLRFVDLPHVDDWVAAWTTPNDRGPGVYLAGVELYAGPVREVAVIDGACAVWLADGVGWGCR